MRIELYMIPLCRRLLTSSQRITRNCFKQGISLRPCSSSPNEIRNPAPIFSNEKVQEILKRVTGIDLEKVFRFRQVSAKSRARKYHLMTSEQIKDLQAMNVDRAKALLQPAPFMNVRDKESAVLSEDSEIEGFDDSQFVFTDVTFGLKDKDRAVVIREPSGLLRQANGDERDLYLQIYFPKEGRMYKVPKLFGAEYLEKLLNAGRYEYVLDAAIVQFEPDDENFIRVTSRIYEYIAEKNDFDVLRSTRHFGHMTFYFTFNHQLDKLLTDTVRRNLVEDAGDMVRLYSLVHPSSSCARATALDDLDAMQLIQIFLDTTAREKGNLELAFQSLLDKKQVLHS